MRPARFLIPSALLAILSASTAACADDLPGPADQAAIKGVINDQLQAFKSGDAVAAESFASAGIREKFPDPAAFLGMVRQAYGALVGPRSFRFGELSQTPLGLVQKLTVVDSAGAVWTAAYTMTFVDGQWRISGCYMLKSEAVDA